MKLGTKSVLFGAHQFIIHPLLVALAWWRLFGFPFDPRLWLAFFVHDLGYIGKPNMDGPEGDRHVEWGARFMGCLFGKKWRDFCLYHSRFFAKQDGKSISRLCVADKFSLVIQPAWLYLPMARATGEIKEYMKLTEKRANDDEPVNKYESMSIAVESEQEWYAGVQSYLSRWVEEHKDGREDLWTPDSSGRVARDANGVWQ